MDDCFALQYLIFELTNLSNRSNFLKIKESAKNGDLDMESYVQATERLELESGKTVVTAYNACYKKWGCSTCEWQWIEQFKTFEEYYKHIQPEHKRSYERYWTDNFAKYYYNKHWKDIP